MPNKTIQDALINSFNSFGEYKIAIEYKGAKISYSELDSRSNIVADYLVSRGINKGSLIGILVNDKVELITLIIGILKAGCVFVPLDSAYPVNRLKRMIISTNICHVFADNNLSYDLLKCLGEENYNLEVIMNYEQFPVTQNLKQPFSYNIEYDPEDMIYIYFTSGTSGKPKAIAGRNKGLLHFINWEIETFNVNSNSRVSQLTSQCHDPFLRDIFTALCAGGTVCIPENRQIILMEDKIIDWIEESRVEIIHCTPGIFKVFISNPIKNTRLPELKNILLAGEKVNSHDIAKWYESFGDRIQLVNLYGPTETTLAKLYYLITPADIKRKSIPIGKPVKGAKVIILDKYMKVCNHGEIGEIYIRTPYRSLGYYNDPDLTKSKFIPNPYNNDPDDLIYKTGDQGRLLDDGNIEFVGRNDHQIKIRGFRVEMSEIENELTKHEAVKECVVNFIEESESKMDFDDIKEGYLAAYIVLNGNKCDTQLREYLEHSLPDYMIPSYFVFIDSIPLNPNGKIDHKSLPDPKKCVRREYVQPGNETEKKLAGMWCEILGIKEVGIDENFMQIGGNSLNIMSLISKVYKEFGVELPIGEVSQNPTIESIGVFIKNSLQNNGYNSINELFCGNGNTNSNLKPDLEPFKPISSGDVLFRRNHNALNKMYLAGIEPYNDIYYKGCFFNAFFPILNHFNIDLFSFISNDIIVYEYNKNLERADFGIKFISIRDAEELLNDVGLYAESRKVAADIIDNIIDSISLHRPVIIGVDCFYESIRPDMYKKNNWSHYVSIYGYDQDTATVNILEHDNVYNLTYRKCRIGYTDIYNSYNGRLKNFSRNNRLPNYLEFYTNSNETKENNLIRNYSTVFLDNMSNNKHLIYSSLENIKQIAEFFMKVGNSEDKLIDGINGITISLTNIVNAKIAERYKINKLLNGQEELIGIINIIINNWSFARSICEKIKLTKKYHQESLEKIFVKLMQIYEMENSYNDLLFGLINNQSM